MVIPVGTFKALRLNVRSTQRITKALDGQVTGPRTKTSQTVLGLCVGKLILYSQSWWQSLLDSIHQFDVIDVHLSSDLVNPRTMHLHVTWSTTPAKRPCANSISALPLQSATPHASVHRKAQWHDHHQESFKYPPKYPCSIIITPSSITYSPHRIK